MGHLIKDSNGIIMKTSINLPPYRPTSFNEYKKYNSAEMLSDKIILKQNTQSKYTSTVILHSSGFQTF